MVYWVPDNVPIFDAAQNPKEFLKPPPRNTAVSWRLSLRRAWICPRFRRLCSEPFPSEKDAQ